MKVSILKLARLGHPILCKTALPVSDLHDPAVQRLINDMLETMYDAGGVGLAAPQVHVGLRLFVLRLPPARPGTDADGTQAEDSVLINPEIELLAGEQVDGWEGCLSIPGLRGRVPRASQVQYRALDKDGTPVEGVATGFHARVLQHEFDHLNGVLYPMRITDFRSFGFTDELARAGIYGE